MARGIDIVSWATLTSMINEAKSPNTFLQKRLFGTHRSLLTETVEIACKVGSRICAPFVRKNGQAIMVEGLTSKAHYVEAPNIRIKRPMEASNLITARPLDAPIYPNRSQLERAIAGKIADDVQVLADDITNTIEWLCAQILRGVITYSVEDREVYTITFPRTAGHSFTDSAPWDVSPATTPNIHATNLAVKRLMAANVGLAPTDCILGSSASDALMAVVKGQELPLLDKNSGAQTGRYAAFQEQYREDGVLYLGRLDGIDFWEYARQTTLDGAVVDLIRPKYAEYIANVPAAEFELDFAAIGDFDAPNGLFVGERFSKAWTEKDPSVLIQLAASRPLPIPRRPDATASVKVVSG